MAVKASSTEELGEAIKNGVDEIIIEGDAKNKTIRIKAVGNVAWVVAFGSIAVAVVAIIVTAGSGGTSLAITGTSEVIAFTTASSVVGASTTIGAISIAVAAGSIGALTTLRNKYKLIKRGDVTLLVKK